MSEINFTITEFPRNLSESYSAIAGTEGRITFHINSREFFCEDNMLVLEFGVALKKWLDALEANDKSNFLYSSLIVEEEPFIQFIYAGENKFEIKCAWNSRSENTSREDLVQASLEFLRQLKVQLKESYSYIAPQL